PPSFLRAPYNDIMNVWNTNDRTKDDLFRPLQELRSPLTTEALRAHTAARIGSLSVFQQFRWLIAEFLLLGAIAAMFVNLSAPISTATFRPKAAIKELTQPERISYVHEMNPIREQRSHSNANIIYFPAPTEHHALTPALQSIDVATAAVPAPMWGSQIPELHSIVSATADSRTPTWTIAGLGGALFEDLRIPSGGGELAFRTGWQVAALSFQAGDASRGLKDLIARDPNGTVPTLFGEHTQRISFLFGAASQVGPFTLQTMVGPSYRVSSLRYFTPATGKTSAPVAIQGLGIAAQADILYPMSGPVSIGLTGMLRYGERQMTSGLSATLEYTFAP